MESILHRNNISTDSRVQEIAGLPLATSSASADAAAPFRTKESLCRACTTSRLMGLRRLRFSFPLLLVMSWITSLCDIRAPSVSITPPMANFFQTVENFFESSHPTVSDSVLCTNVTRLRSLSHLGLTVPYQMAGSHTLLIFLLNGGKMMSHQL